MASKKTTKKPSRKKIKPKKSRVSNKMRSIYFPLQPFQKANLRDASVLFRKFANIKSQRQAENLVQKGGGGWLTAALLIPDLYRALRYLIKSEKK